MNGIHSRNSGEDVTMSTSNNNRINDDNHVDRSVTTDQPNDGDRGAGSSISDSNSSSGNRPVQPPQKYLQYAEKPTTSSGEFDDNTIELKVTPVMEDDENNDHSCNIMNDNSRNEQHPISESQVDGTIRKLSLNTIYGNRIGIIQSIVLLLNIGLLLYAHIGISAVIVSNQKRIDAYDDQSSNNNNNNNNTTTANGGSCTELPNDMTLWYNQGGQMNRSDHSNYCSRTYVWNVTQNVCLLDRTCISQCFQDRYGYSVNCAACFAAVPACGLQNGCAGMCATDHASVECETCNIPCTQQLETCTGLTTTNATTNSTTNDTNNVRRWLTDSKDDQNEEICRTQQMGVHWDRVVDRTKFHIVYTLRFMYAIRDAWNGNAKVLAILVVLFSGIWPYVKILLLYATWYYPFTKTSTQRYGILVSLKRLGKYTFVDVYVSTRCANTMHHMPRTNTKQSKQIAPFFLALDSLFCARQ